MTAHYQPTAQEKARLLLLLTREGVEYAELLAQWAQPLPRPYALRLIFAALVAEGLAELRGTPALYCLGDGPGVEAALAQARNAAPLPLPDLSPVEARVLLSVTLEGESSAEIRERLVERGQGLRPALITAALKTLVELGLVETEERHSGGRGRGTRLYRLTTRPGIEDALDLAFTLKK